MNEIGLKKSRYPINIEKNAWCYVKDNSIEFYQQYVHRGRGFNPIQKFELPLKILKKMVKQLEPK